jgi:hypothetical protein
VRCRRLSFVLLLLCVACAGSDIHTDADIPVSWSLGQADAPDASVSVVCQSSQPEPCVLDHSTDQKPKFASFALHLWGPAPTTFTGYLLATYLNDPDPRHYRSDVNVTSLGKETRHSFFAKVTSTPRQYSVTVHLEETREGAPPKNHDFTVPVLVK